MVTLARVSPLATIWMVALLALVQLARTEGRYVSFRRNGFPMSHTHLPEIPLTRSETSEHKQYTVLMQLRARQQNPSLLEMGDVPLEQEILSEKHLATYFGTIAIGLKQTTYFKVLFDTGSCEFWVPSSVCNTNRCMRHARFPSGRPMRLASRAGMNIQYLSGKVAGDMVYKTVKLGDILVKDQVVGLARIVDIELLDDVKWDGILGLAYPNPTLTAQNVIPLFDNMIMNRVLSGQNLANQFAYFLDDQRGVITFGGASCKLINVDNDQACIDKFHFVPVTEKTYWTIKIRDVRVRYPSRPELRGFCPPGGCNAIVDTGTYLIYGPAGQVSRMMNPDIGSCMEYNSLPEITFDFCTSAVCSPGERAVSLTLRPIDYVLKFDIRNREECVVGISPDKDVIWTLGQVFLRSFYTVFDRDEDRVGFAQLPPRTQFLAINHGRPTLFLEEKQHAHAELRLEEGEDDTVAEAEASQSREMSPSQHLHTAFKRGVIQDKAPEPSAGKAEEESDGVAKSLNADAELQSNTVSSRGPSRVDFGRYDGVRERRSDAKIFA